MNGTDADELQPYVEREMERRPKLSHNRAIGFAALSMIRAGGGIIDSELSTPTRRVLSALREEGLTKLEHDRWSLTRTGRHVHRSGPNLSATISWAQWRFVDNARSLLPVIVAAGTIGFAGYLVDNAAPRSFFEAAVQVIPVILLALAVDTRLLRFQSIRVPKTSLILGRSDRRIVKTAFFVTESYRGFVALALVLAEIAAFQELSKDAQTLDNAKLVMAAIACGVISIALDALLASGSTLNHNEAPAEERP